VSVTNPLDGQNNPSPLATLEAVQPYEDSCIIVFSSGNTCNFQAVPAGKRLVIQAFDAQGKLETGLKPVSIFVLQQNDGISHFFTATFMGTTINLDWFATHQETRLYVGSNGTLSCTVEIFASSNGAYTCVLSGFLVDTP